MTKPVMIRNFFEKISTASAAKAPEQLAAPAAVVTVELPELAEALAIPVYAPYNDACPPLTTRNNAATRALANDFGVGLPPMAYSFN
ncbi:MAG: hypothetical protein P4L53_03460 [Candidatus Obscuribacterales bacterium]|nr:hypothetical protein [Candidatus Obscuribacterales bacterium]